MSSYTKIKHIATYLLNHAEYLTFMNNVLGIIAKPEALGVSADFIGVMERELALLADAVNESRIAQETEEAAAHESNRSYLASYVLTRISGSGTLPLEAERDAGQFLYKVVKPYTGIARLPQAQKSAAIQGLLIDLRKDENTPYVAVLGLEGYLSELENENGAFVELSTARTQSRAANRLESGTKVRRRTDALYDDLVTLAQAYSIAIPSEEATTFVGNINQLISETITAYNQRGKQPRKRRKDAE